MSVLINSTVVSKVSSRLSTIHFVSFNGLLYVLPLYTNVPALFCIGCGVLLPRVLRRACPKCSFLTSIRLNDSGPLRWILSHTPLSIGMSAHLICLLTYFLLTRQQYPRRLSSDYQWQYLES